MLTDQRSKNISIEADEHLTNFNTDSVKSTLNKLEIEGKYLSLINFIYERHA